MVKVELGLSTMIGLLRMLAASRGTVGGLSDTERQTLKDNLISAVVSELEGIGVASSAPAPKRPEAPQPVCIPGRIQLTIEETSFIYSLLGYHVGGGYCANMSRVHSVIAKLNQSVPHNRLSYTQLPTAHNKHTIFLV